MSSERKRTYYEVVCTNGYMPNGPVCESREEAGAEIRRERLSSRSFRVTPRRLTPAEYAELPEHQEY